MQGGLGKWVAVLVRREADERTIVGPSWTAPAVDCDRVCREHAADLRRLIGRMVPKNAVEDVLQETLLRVHQGRDRFDTSRPLWPLLATLAYRSCAQWWRCHHPSDELAADGAAPTTGSSTFPGSDDHIVGLEQARAVATAMASLSPRQQRVLYLHDVHGYPSDHLAVSERMSVKAVRSALDRARASFRRAYRDPIGLTAAVVGTGRARWARWRARIAQVRAEGCERLGLLAGTAVSVTVMGILASAPSSPPTTGSSGASTDARVSAVDLRSGVPASAVSETAGSVGRTAGASLPPSATAPSGGGPSTARPPVAVTTRNSVTHTPEKIGRAHV